MVAQMGFGGVLVWALCGIPLPPLLACGFLGFFPWSSRIFFFSLVGGVVNEKDVTIPYALLFYLF